MGARSSRTERPPNSHPKSRRKESLRHRDARSGATRPRWDRRTAACHGTGKTDGGGNRRSRLRLHARQAESRAVMTSRSRLAPVKQSEAEARLKLMVVDDGPLVSSLAHALSSGGFRIELAPDPDQALADTRGQRYDAIV